MRLPGSLSSYVQPHTISLLHLSCVAYKPTFVAEYHVWEERRSEHEMGMNYAGG
jgi:hypothetical protein